MGHTLNKAKLSDYVLLKASEAVGPLRFNRRRSAHPDAGKCVFGDRIRLELQIRDEIEVSFDLVLELRDQISK